MGVPPTLVRVLVGRFGEVASPEAARSMSVEQVVTKSRLLTWN